MEQQNEEMEIALLGAIIHDPGIVESLDIRSDLFTSPPALAVFQAVVRVQMDGLTVNEPTLSQALGEMEKGEHIGFMAGIQHFTAANAEYYVAKLREAAHARKLAPLLRDALGALEAGRPAGEVVEGLERGLSGAAPEEPEERLTFAGLVEFLRAEREGVATGLRALDSRGIRIPRGALTVIGARPGMGKTSLMLTLARTLAMPKEGPGMAVLYYTYEEAPPHLAVKIGLAMLGPHTPIAPAPEVWRTACNIIRGASCGELFPAAPAQEAAEKMRRDLCAAMARPLTLHKGPPNIDALASSIRRERRRLGEELGAVFVDYVQLVPGKGSGTSYTRQTELAGISARLRDLARDTGLSIILGAQLTRGKDERESSFREADDILNDASLVLLLKCKEEREREEAGPIAPYEIHVAKNRDGPAGGLVKLAFRGRCRQFLDLGELTASERAIYEAALNAEARGAGEARPRRGAGTQATAGRAMRAECMGG